ncbi:MAG: hypothetical protein U5J89_06230 [Fodinibius sp.]|nr:hypothetical protein [Fodinibius sp.]MDZ7658861.1 hypothetical protein [Fodinibius sp.]
MGHKVPAGTGLRKYDDLIVGKKEELDEEEQEVAKVFDELAGSEGNGEEAKPTAEADVEDDES